MKTSDRERFAQLLADVMAFYRQDLSTFALSVWWQASERFDFDQVRKALTKHAMDPERGQFAPKPADLVRALEGTATDRALMAWGKVLDAIQRVGQYQDVVFDDAAIHAAVDDLGGWPKVCITELKDLSYVQHRFTESHRAYTANGAFGYPRKLMGNRSGDDVYMQRGLPAPVPVVVGDPVLAKRVYQGGQVGAKTAISFLEQVGAGLTALLDNPARDAA